MQVFACTKKYIDELDIRMTEYNIIKSITLDLGLAEKTLKDGYCDSVFKFDTDLTYDELGDLIGLDLDEVINDLVNTQIAELNDKYNIDIQYTWNYKDWLYLEEI